MPELTTLGGPIKSTYEGQPNTNAFTDAEKAKLANLSELASSGQWDDVDGKPTVIAAGATEADARSAIGALASVEKGAANGVATLDGSGQVPLSQINLEGLSYKGLWDASTNTPSITNGVGEDADFYFSSTDGTVDLGSGPIEFLEGDAVIYHDGVWARRGSSQIVQSVNGQIGIVTVTPASIGALPDTYQPSWDDIEGKPALPALQRGNIGPAIPALRAVLVDNQTIANATRTKITPWGSGYDQFGIRNGADFIMPAWAQYARVTCCIAMQDLSAGNHMHLQIRRGSDVVATGSVRGMDTANPPSVYADTGILPVSGGDSFHAHVRHNYGSPRSVTMIGGTMFNIELYEAI